MSKMFLGGVVEGFYGQPWNQAQRLELFQRMQAWGLNSYFYAPKDDLKHRAAWRELYNKNELDVLRELVDQCNERDLVFIYGLSPGLDIRFSDKAEVANIQAKLEQLAQLDVKHFALLFDDLPGEMSDGDRQAYGSVAEAQADVSNQIYAWRQNVDPQSRLLFCPTPYCDRMVSWELGGKDYLEQLGAHLDLDIDVLWTGPEIISQEISVESIQELSSKINRKPVIWDNLHANDYDVRRLYCGPYTGRSSRLLTQVNGILANPNNEFPINFVPLQTLGRFIREHDAYVADTAYEEAIHEWVSEYQTADHATQPDVSVDDLRLLADCYYLPFSEGRTATALIQLCQKLISKTSEDWDADFREFQAYNERVQRLSEQLTQLKKRDLFYAWSRRIWELREELDLIERFLRQLKKGPKSIHSEHHLPGTYRGGIVAKLQRQLAFDRDGKLSATNSSTRG